MKSSHLSVYQLLISQVSNIRFSFLLIVLAVFFSLFSLYQALDQPLLEAHAFRQTHTALTSFWFLKEGFNFNYITPVLGESWSIPFEFPIYQYVVSFFVLIFDSELGQTGRLVSQVFWFLTCFYIRRFLKFHGVDDVASLTTLAICATAPLYLFWSSTFMIESAALFFCVGFLYYGSIISRGAADKKVFLLAFMFLSLGMLQKVTTLLPSLLFLGIIHFLFSINLKRAQEKNYLVYQLKFFAVALTGVALAYVWVVYSDASKSDNILAKTYLTSEKLAQWNYGTLEQRFNLGVWKTIFWERFFRSDWSLMLIYVSPVFTSLVLSSKYRKLILLSIAAGFTPLLIFLNLHRIHDYYQFSSFVFFFVAIGLSVCSLRDYFEGRFNVKWPGVFLVVLVISTNAVAYKNHYYKLRTWEIKPETSLELKLALKVKEITNPEDYVVFFGFGWSGHMAYYSERKALTMSWPNFQERFFSDHSIFLSKAPSAVVACRDERNGLGISEIESLTYKTFDVERKFDVKAWRKKGFETCQIYKIK